MLVLGVGIGAANLEVFGAAADKADLTHRRFHESRILIQPKATVDSGRLKQFHAFHKMRGVRRLSESSSLEAVDLPAGASVADTIKKYRDSGLVEFAEPDYYLYASIIPNDPQFRDGLLWPLNNIGQNGGTADADIDAPEAWDVLHAASNIVVAVIDSGIRYTHEDLAANMWRNPGEIANNGIDDDGDGIVDDVYGLNAITNGGDPFDDNGHGTHVAGIIGAEGNNGKGGAGVAWKVQLMACKFMDRDGMGATSDAIRCIDYARKHGANIINASWGGPDSSLALEAAIRRARDAGIIFVAAAGNEAANNDIIPSYPANYNLDNIVSVAAMTRNDLLDTTYSNFGKSKVDLGAPGTFIYSTWNTSDSAYANMSGTSMATPIVSGVFALVRAKFPNETYAQAIKRVFDATDKLPSLAGKCVTGGRVNLNRALQPDPTVIVAKTGILSLLPATGFVVRGFSGSAFNVETQMYVLSNAGNKSLNWNAVKDQPWLVITPPFGVLAPGENAAVIASVLPEARSLSVGTYSGSLTFQDDTGGKLQSALPVSLTIQPPPAAGILSVAPATGFDARGFPGTGFNVESQTYVLSNAGNQSLNWIAVQDQSWLAVTPSSGVLAPGENVMVTASLQPEARSLSVGTYSASLTFQDNTGGRAQLPLPVSVTIQAAPAPPASGILSVAPATGFDVRGFPGGGFNVESQTYVLANVGNKSLNWFAMKDQSWLAITPSFGVLASGESVTVTASLQPEARSLSVGTYSGSFTFQDDTGGKAQLPLPVSVTIQALPALEVVPSAATKIFQFQLSSPGGSTIVTEASTDLQNWIPIATNTVSIDGHFAFTDPDGQKLTQRFFRARMMSKSELQTSKVPIGAASVKK